MRLSRLSGSVKRLFIIVLCTSWSVGCSLSRIADKKHHWWDVLAGATLGTSCVFYTLRLLNKNGIEDSQSSSNDSTTNKTLKKN